MQTPQYQRIPTPKQSPPDLTDQEFRQILTFIESDAGIRLPETNYQIVTRFAVKRMAKLNLSFNQYLGLLKQQHIDEYNHFLDAITINETYFFREQKHFQVLERLIVPQLATSGSFPIRFWSAACSTGEEATSMAALAERYWGQPSSADYSVMASDINPYALAMFRAGEFRANSFREDGTAYHPMLKSVLRQSHDRWMLKTTVKHHLDIRNINVFRDDLAQFANQFHVIFLRNMLIYMTMPIRRKILDNIVPTLKEGGYLFLASSEMPLISHANLMLQEYDSVYFFHKKTLQEKQRGLTFDRDVLQDIQQPTHSPSSTDSQSPRHRKAEVNLEDMLFCANQKLNNRLFTAVKNPNYAFALSFLRLVVVINEKKLSEAHNVLNDLMKEIGLNEITCYFSGYLKMIEEQHQEAVQFFRQALIHNQQFWPARFYLAMLLRRTNPSAASQEFTTCRANIDAYIQQDRRDYQCLLEGFNAKYFLNICQKLAATLPQKTLKKL